ncbi:MAG: lysophospholipid acyltransferase family protein [Kiritimatiellia bacterium]|jgi:KDO2-lipid IV(A) lauroyltransferase|nr:lysophospholipid acyltransferase family protein [Kiritimatiellia bacterium]MDP6848221.1 lysophospholipid acyltransferase family protein [Kiritimatiellia bacterium]
MIIQDNIFRDMAKLVAWYPLRWCVTVSPWRMVYTMGKLAGAGDARIEKGRIRRITDNLLSVYGDKMIEEDAAKIANRIVQRHFVEHMEFYKFATLNRGNIDKRIKFEGLEHLDAALEKGKGAILAHMHFGSKQFPLVALGHMDYAVNQIGYRDTTAPDHSFIHKHVHLRIRNRLESKFKARHIHLNNSLRPAYRALQNNEVLFIASDGIGGIRGIGPNYLPVPFLGKTMSFPPGPARMARKTGAALIPLLCLQQQDWTYKAVLEKPVEVVQTENSKQDVQNIVLRYTEVFEKYISKYPDHWMFWEEFQEGNLVHS